MSRYEIQVYSILRFVIGFLFLWHGSQKLIALPQAGIVIPHYIVFVAGPIEFFGGLLVMVGFLTRWVAFICSGEMAFAYWIAHGTNVVLPFLNGGELAIVYCFLFLFISTRGSGVLSVDHFLEKRKKNQSLHHS